MQFVDVLVRQAHPGPGADLYHADWQKVRDAERYCHDESIPWTVLVDDLAGTVHRTYGGRADPTCLIDAENRVVFYLRWTHGSTLHRAVEALLAQVGRGVVLGGINRVPHLTHAMVDGWPGLQRTVPQSVVDLERSLPGRAAGARLTHQFRPFLTPIFLRSRPLPEMVNVMMAILVAVARGVIARRLTRSESGGHDPI